jgi:hypothetical protein
MRARLALLLLLALVAAGCGSASGGGGGGEGSASPPAGASLVPDSAQALVAVATDDGSDQWKKADALLQKFPGRDKLLSYFRDELAKEGLDYEHDLRPALGPEVDIAVFDLADADNTAVGLTKPDDPDKLVSLLKKGDDAPQVIEKRDDGWVVFGDSQSAVDRIGADGAKLADSSAYKEALGKLPEEALLTAWVDGPPVAAALKKESGGTSAGQLDKLDWAAAALEARDNGAALHVVAKGVGSNLESFESSLVDKVPADTLLFATFKGIDKQLGDVEEQAGSSGALLEGFLGVKLEDLASLFSGETAVYARPGTPLPEITVVLDDTNAAAKLATLDKLAAKAVAAFEARGPSPTTVDGASLQELRFGPFAILYGKAGGKIVVTDTRNAVRDLSGGGGSSLADSDAFENAKEAAGMPDSTVGFFYVNLKDSIAEISGLAGESIPPDVAANLRPLRTVLGYATVDGDVLSATVFLEIQ